MFIITSPEYNVSGPVIIMSWFDAQLAGLVCGCGSMLEQSRWLRSIDIISGHNSIQATSNNLHPPMALNANSFGFYVVSRKYIPSYAIFHDLVEQFYDGTWVGVNSNWMSQLLYEWQKFMSSTCPFLFSDPWCSYTFQQPWKVSNNFSIVNVDTTLP